ncbi:hypothetical protein [Streptomyces albidoflavus]|uniref:hypothetical protein n=1 Tax=Streptomyces albidoflavus TaxID=1886 RepID=UPI0010224816|nr:hypothetical protein [Streptomyces albidoflavus]RZF02675.1 hypothetical protein C0R05_32710 [Streptomyces albidoflavus]
MNTTTTYTITTAADVLVATRTAGKAADKLAAKLTEETGQVHRVYTPTGKLRLETEVEMNLVAEAAPVELAEEVTDEAFDALLLDCLAEAAVEKAVEEDTEAAAEEVEEEAEVASYSTVLAQLSDTDPAVREAAKAEWARRLEIYRDASRDKDPAKRIVGPAMAAALEAGGTTDGRTRAALIRRGLATAGEGATLLVNAAGHKAAAAALTAIA